MRKIRISDVTMQQATDRVALSFREKIELAKLLDKLGCSVIELEGISSPRSDALRIKSIASAVKESIVAVPVALEDNADAVWAALSQARFPRLQVPAATSPVQMEYLHHKKPEAMLKCIADVVAHCRRLCENVEFIAQDATRADPDFLARAIQTALEAGAAQITLCDTAGTMLPDEFARFTAEVRKNIPEEISVAVACADSLSMADACSMAALGADISEIKASAYPVTSASLGNISRIICARGDSFGAMCSVRVTQLSRILGQIAAICESGRTKASPLDNSVHPEDPELFLTAHDDFQSLMNAVERLGYEISPEDAQKVYDAFCTIAARKERVSSRELDAIVASAAMQVPPAYNLEVYSIQSGNTVSATAHLRLTKDGKALEGVSIGDGPIDAAFLAIEQITGCHYELDDFQIQAVTEGREAMGQTVVKLLSGGKLYSGRGISTDIVGASIQAYLSALNKIVYEEAAV